ncbi:type II restriction endonuclease [Anaerotignum faecicola]
MSRIFDEWLHTFRKSINGYNYYIDFQKVYENAEKLKIEINILNTLVGSQNIEGEFEDILTKYPECLKAIPILLAVRENEIYCQDENGAISYRFDKKTQSIEQYKYFMQETGLFDMLKNHIISNLYDYVTGIEVGLSSNGRKNRGGHQMEQLVESYLKKMGLQKNKDYFPEMYLTDIEKKWNIDLSAISADGTSTKRWDFVVKTPSCIYVIETNFYTSSGSKLNETARSYKMIAEEARNIPNFRFVWITDGAGWNRAKRNLQETFNVLETMYNIADMENNIFPAVFK